MNNAIKEIKRTLEGTDSRITETENRISEVEDRMVEINEHILIIATKLLCSEDTYVHICRSGAE